VSTPTSSGRASTWIGIAVGVVLLGLVAAFAIALPKAADADDADSPALDLSLPDTLPGGYTAADDPDSFQGGQLASQAESIAGQQAANSTYGNKVLPDVLGRSAVTRTYVLDGTKAVFVQAFESEGGAFAPNSIPDPANGSPATVMKQVGDGACILSYGQPVQGQAATEPAFSQCQVTRDRVTVQIGASGIDAADLVDVAGGLADDLQD
jgi:hypothetical protein